MALITAEMLGGRDFEGTEHRASVSLIMNESGPGEGPRLHRHPYDETWVVQEGTVSFRLGEERFTAKAGDIVVAPAGAPHAFRNDGACRAKLVCIHASPTFIGEWLE